MSDLSPFADAFAAVRSAFELWRMAIGAARETVDLLPDAQEKQAAGRALEEAVQASEVAEAQLAQALGYELCRCQFPPIPMLQIGYLNPRGTRFHQAHQETQQVYECPLCKQNTAGAWTFTRKIPV